MKIKPTTEFVQKNYDKTLSLIDQYVNDDGRNKQLKDMIDFFGERYALAPASSKTDHHCAFPGGLCFHNLHVFHWIEKFSDLMAKEKYSKETLLSVSLLHDLGKIGDIKDEYYLKQESQWHRERGMLYEINPNITFMLVPDRSLYIASQFGIKLGQEEYLAIRIHDGQYEDANKRYAMKENTLSRILHFADYHATMLEKDFEIDYE